MVVQGSGLRGWTIVTPPDARCIHFLAAEQPLHFDDMPIENWKVTACTMDVGLGLGHFAAFVDSQIFQMLL
ncbi:hypothetical protein Hypma_004580 [Hypsizygus marmoreus]|uniref:Uncharacterized protein n=1 Tax=Hypsizygus marmoreus TaxID=39966 RepID=A0A369JZK1_HYPMA|nr:hypothetical protein Hypma_004580 [Hypsizygus marmoreus]